jgi:hypothetical protein
MIISHVRDVASSATLRVCVANAPSPSHHREGKNP